MWGLDLFVQHILQIKILEILMQTKGQNLETFVMFLQLFLNNLLCDILLKVNTYFGVRHWTTISQQNIILNILVLTQASLLHISDV